MEKVMDYEKTKGLVTVHRSMNSLPDDQVPLDVLKVRFKAMKEFNFWNLEMDCRRFAEMITIWREKELYRHFYDSWQEFLDDYIEKPQAWVDHVLEGVELLGNSQPISTKDALQASLEKAKANPIAANGQIGNGRPKSSYDNIIATTQQGTSQEYLARRLSRDHPEVLDEIGEGKRFKSVRQAAIATGIIKPKITVQFDPEETGSQIASKLYQKLTEDQLRETIENLLNYFGDQL
jgi:DNA gyrase/topoisomerase IV subunit B